jgi:hypothetical protein
MALIRLIVNCAPNGNFPIFRSLPLSPDDFSHDSTNRPLPHLPPRASSILKQPTSISYPPLPSSSRRSVIPSVAPRDRCAVFVPVADADIPPSSTARDRRMSTTSFSPSTAIAGQSWRSRRRGQQDWHRLQASSTGPSMCMNASPCALLCHSYQICPAHHGQRGPSP